MKSKLLFLSAALALQVTQLSAALTEQRQQALVNQPITQTSENFYDRRSEGWYWYEDPEAKKKQKVVTVKEVKLRPNIEQHDFNVKLKNALRFIEDGDKVKVTIMFRGRELSHPDLGRQILIKMAEELKELVVVEREPKLEGKNMIMILSPKPHN